MTVTIFSQLKFLKKQLHFTYYDTLYYLGMNVGNSLLTVVLK